MTRSRWPEATVQRGCQADLQHGPEDLPLRKDAGHVPLSPSPALTTRAVRPAADLSSASTHPPLLSQSQAGRCEPCIHPLPDQGSLVLGECPEEIVEELATRGRGVCRCPP